jgi:serine/threonine protein kinase/Tfp pilus assembly protein PilF
VGLALADEAGGLEAGGSRSLQADKSSLEPTRYFGDYEILGELARGGMGVVYRARQVFLNRPVALKMIAAGQLATPAQVQRFQIEAEAAARLDHPNIVPIYEVGMYDGRHFYSMKLIEGGALSQSLAERPSTFSIREAVTLLATVARAVHYAHQHGVLHRDLKPTNILLDARGQPHVTDFGLAKLFEEDPALTPSSAVLGTPAYMAPEMATGKAAEATTAADIYGLGAVLYELLAGRPPFRADNVPALLQKIVEEDPPPVADGLVPRPPRDLEIICLKCLEKNPANRYASTAALADDLENWRDGKPILARPASGAEKFWRWCRRKPAVAALWGALALALSSGVTGVIWAWQRAKADEERAHIEAAKTRHFASFLHQMLYRIGPSVALGRDTTLLREILDQTAGRLGTELTNQPIVAAELYDTIGHTYYDLGEYSKAAAMHREAVQLRRTAGGTGTAEFAQSLHLLSQDLAVLNQLREAEDLNEQAIAIRKAVFGPNDRKVADSLNNQGNVYFRQTNYNRAQQCFEEALEIYRRATVTDIASVLNNLANVFTMRHDYPKAEQLYREAVDKARASYGDSHPKTALYLRNLGDVLRGQDKLDEADAVHSESLAVRANLLGELHPLLADSLERLAIVKNLEQRWPEAEALYRKALILRRKQAPDEPRQWDGDANALADLLNQQGKFDETEQSLTELLAGTRDDDPRTARLRAIRGSARARHGRWREAVPDLSRAVNLAPDEHWYAMLLGPLLVETGDRSAYEALCHRCVSQFGGTSNAEVAIRIAQTCLLAPGSNDVIAAAEMLVDSALAAPKYNGKAYGVGPKALAEYRSGRPAEAVARLEQLLKELAGGQVKAGRFVSVQANATLAMAHQSLGHYDAAHAALSRALTVAPPKIAVPTDGNYGTWHEWLILQINIREARTLLASTNVNQQ